MDKDQNKMRAVLSWFPQFWKPASGNLSRTTNYIWYLTFHVYLQLSKVALYFSQLGVKSS